MSFDAAMTVQMGAMILVSIAERSLSSLFSSAKVRLFFQSRNTFPPLFPPKPPFVDIRHSIPYVVDIGQFAARWHLLVWVKRRGEYCPAAKQRGTVAFSFEDLFTSEIYAFSLAMNILRRLPYLLNERRSAR